MGAIIILVIFVLIGIIADNTNNTNSGEKSSSDSGNQKVTRYIWVNNFDQIPTVKYWLNYFDIDYEESSPGAYLVSDDDWPRAVNILLNDHIDINY